MSKVKELEELLKTDVLLEINSELEAIEKLLKNKNDKDLIAELEYLKDVKKFYDEAILMIEKNTMSEEEAENILLDLEDMLADEDDV